MQIEYGALMQNVLIEVPVKDSNSDEEQPLIRPQRTHQPFIPRHEGKILNFTFLSCFSPLR